MTLHEARNIMQLGANFSEQELKNAYRLKAKKAHPDHSGCAEDFKLLNAAYEYLKQAPRTTFEPTYTDFTKINLDITEKISISFIDACTGCVKRIAADRHVLVMKPNLCPICVGRGWIVRENYPITKCNVCNINRAPHKFSKSIRIPAGISSGNILTFSSEGHSIDGSVGSLRIEVQVKKSRTLSRQEQDIVEVKDVKYSDLLLGRSLIVNTIHGDVKVEIPYGSFDGDSLRIKGRGIKTKKAAGNHIIKLRLVSPKSLNRDQKEALEDLRRVGL